MSTGTGALQMTYPGQKRADKRTFIRRILLTKKDRNRPMKITDFTGVFQPIPLRLNYRLISTIQYLQRLFIHKKITPARLACLCLTWFGLSFPAGQFVSVRSFLIAATTQYSRLFLLSLVTRFACDIGQLAKIWI